MATQVMTMTETNNPALNIGQGILRYGLVLVLGWIGAMKFTAYEAAGIQPLIATSPLMSWMYKVLSVQGVSNLIGATEIIIAALIASRAFSPRLSAVGSALAIPVFLTTITFLFSLPGWEASLGGFPALSGNGGFLLKDVTLLGASVYTLGESLQAAKSNS
jgi:uncharacterized membrane protein YkgB